MSSGNNEASLSVMYALGPLLCHRPHTASGSSTAEGVLLSSAFLLVGALSLFSFSQLLTSLAPQTCREWNDI